jgi:Uma2 family endonuclease
MNMTIPVNVPHPVKLRIEDFEVLDRTGAFADLKKVELIEGMIVGMSAEFRPHTFVKSQLMYRLQAALEATGSRFSAVVEPTLALPPYNLPEPDVAVVDAPMARDYFRIEHVALVVEVSDTTLENDLGAKLALYARHGVPEYWVVDLAETTVHQFWSVSAEGFSQRRSLPLAGAVPSATLPELKIDGTGLV